MNVTDSIFYVGVNDHTLDLFESQYPVPNGMAYNSYIIIGEKIAVIDSVETHFLQEWLNKIHTALNGRTPDYLVVQHMEPDHSANIDNFMEIYPTAKIVSSAKAFMMMQSYFGTNYPDRQIIVGDGDTLSLGNRTLRFFAAPMVHWPEVIVTHDDQDNVLFTADAFGKFGTLDTAEPWDDEARRYYVGIVGKYGIQTQKLLQTITKLNIEKICSLHGPVLSKNLPHYLNLYDIWSSYRPETNGVTIAYTSVYGNTRQAVDLLAEKLRAVDIPVAVHDLAHGDMFAAVSDAFRYSKLVLASTTYNADVFPFMRTFINHLTERSFQKRTVALIENGSWAPNAAKIMRNMLEKSKELSFTDSTLTIRSALSEENFAQLDTLVQELR